MDNVDGWSGIVYLGPTPFFLVNNTGVLRPVLLQPQVLDIFAVAAVPPYIAAFPISCFAEVNTALLPSGCAFGHMVSVVVTLLGMCTVVSK